MPGSKPVIATQSFSTDIVPNTKAKKPHSIEPISMPPELIALRIRIYAATPPPKAAITSASRCGVLAATVTLGISIVVKSG